MQTHRDRSETGKVGVGFVHEELHRRGYSATRMPEHNPGFDIDCASPQGKAFRVEVKYATSSGTQIPLQVKTHLEAPLNDDLVYIFVRPESRVGLGPEFFLMSHREVQQAWARMEKFKPNGDPYVIRSTGFIDWKHILRHQDKWDKLPE